jgi:hypothetical protein
MRSIKLPKFLEKANFWLYAIGLLIVIAVVYIVFNMTKKTEKFDDYALPAGAEGSAALRDLGLSEDAIGAISDLPIKSQDNNPLKPLIRTCEAAKGWNCAALDNPDFAANCGICSEDGINSMGDKHVGGMYIDPNILAEARAAFREKGTVPNLKPTIGTCNGEFLVVRPHCDTQQDRKYCSTIKKPSAEAFKRCGLVVDAVEPTFVYMGKRGGADSKFALIPETGTAPFKFKIRLNIVVTTSKECTIYLRDPINPGDIDPITKQPKEKKYPGSFMPSSTVYICDVSGVAENQPFELVVKWPEYYDYNWTGEEKKRVNDIVNPKRAPLTRATYGPWTGDYKKDDPRAADVTTYIKNRFKNAADCGDPIIKISNDGCGGDPTPGIVKQLRLAYSFDGNIYAYSFGKEGGETKVEDGGEEGVTYKKLCPPITKQVDADEKVCTQDVYKNPIKNHTYSGDSGTQIQKMYKFWGSSGKTVCVQDAKRPGRAITGMWESVGRTPRRVLFEKTVTLMNGVMPPESGANSLGTMLTNVFQIDNKVTSSINIPNHAKWIWPEADPDRGGVPQIVVFKCVVPATLRDCTKIADTILASSGPICTTMAGAKRCQADPCDKLVMGKKQAPGTFTEACVKGVFLSEGCRRQGLAYPGNPQTKANLTGDGNDVETMRSAVSNMFKVAKTGKDATGKAVPANERNEAINNCFGPYEGSPCETEKFSTGPQTVECLDYLWRNMGRKNKKIGPTYEDNTRSSGAGTKENPAWWCQRAGVLSPIMVNGQPNPASVEIANDIGSVTGIRDFYKEIHKKANHSTNAAEQCLAVEQCYGIRMCGKSSCTGKAAEAAKNCAGAGGKPLPGPPPGTPGEKSPCSGGKTEPTTKPKCPGPDPECSLCPEGTNKCPDGSCADVGSKCPGSKCCGGLSRCPSGAVPDSLTGACPEDSKKSCPDGKPSVGGNCGPCTSGAPRCPDGTCPLADGTCPGTMPPSGPSNAAGAGAGGAGAGAGAGGAGAGAGGAGAGGAGTCPGGAKPCPDGKTCPLPNGSCPGFPMGMGAGGAGGAGRMGGADGMGGAGGMGGMGGMGGAGGFGAGMGAAGGFGIGGGLGGLLGFGGGAGGGAGGGGLPGAPALSRSQAAKASCGVGPADCGKGKRFSTTVGQGTSFTKATF